MKYGWMRATMVALMCAAGVAAGCGDDDDEASTPASTAAAPASTQASTAAASEPATGSPIKIAVTSDNTGPLGSNNQGAGRGMQVWAKWTNANGGILGHKVVLEERDTKSDVTQLTTVTKELLAMDDIVAFVPGGSMGMPVTKLFAAAKVPVVGGLMDDPMWFTNANVFPVGTTPDQLATALAILGIAREGAGAKFGDFYCAEAPSCKQSIPLFEAGIKANGGTLSYQASVSAAAPDYTPQCVAAKAKGVQALWIADTAPIIQRIVNDCAKNEFTPTYVLPQYSNSLGKVKALEGLAVASPVAAPAAPVTKEFRDAVAKYDPGMLEGELSPTFAVQAWASGQAIAKAIETANPTGDVTPQDVYDGLYALKDETIDGLVPPLNFVKGKPTSIGCFFEAKLVAGELSQETEEATCPEP